MVALLPAQPPAVYGLTSSATVAGPDELKGSEGVDAAVVDFLNKNAPTAARVWSNDTGDLLGAVSITKYPYDIFAAAALGEAAHPCRVRRRVNGRARRCTERRLLYRPGRGVRPGRLGVPTR